MMSYLENYKNLISSESATVGDCVIDWSVADDRLVFNEDITIENDGSGARLFVDSYNNSPSAIFFRTANGDKTTPTATLSGDNIMFLQASGNNASGFSAGGVIKYTATENWSGSAKGNDITFKNITNGTTSQKDALKIENDGTLSVAGTTNYETLVTADDDIPNKKYVDDLTSTDLTRRIEITNADLGKGATAPTENIVGVYTVWEYGLNDDSHMDFSMPVDWKSGTDVAIKVRWAINEAYATNSGEVRWQAEWKAVPADGTEAISGAGTTDDSGDINIPGTAYFLVEDTVETIPAASLSAGDEIGLDIKRIALVGGTDPTAEPAIISVDIEYTSNLRY